jgi:hypothetical protein
MASPDAREGQDARIGGIASAIRVIPDFPKPGIMFQDITTLLLDTKAFRDTIDLFVERYKDKEISVVAGIEARGFIFGPPIALAIGAKFVPMRKPNKLPGEVISEEYSLEYGTDIMEMHVGAVQAGERALRCFQTDRHIDYIDCQANQQRALLHDVHGGSGRFMDIVRGFTNGQLVSNVTDERDCSHLSTGI